MAIHPLLRSAIIGEPYDYDTSKHCEYIKSMTNTEFRSAMGCFLTGVTVVTTAKNEVMLGVTANSFSSVSLKPPMVLWSLSKESKKHSAMTSSKNYAINILSKCQESIALSFSQNKEPFMEIDYHLSNIGVPIIKNALAVFECQLHQVYDGGDHSIILGLVTSCNKSDLEPLKFFRGKFN